MIGNEGNVLSQNKQEGLHDSAAFFMHKAGLRCDNIDGQLLKNR